MNPNKQIDNNPQASSLEAQSITVLPGEVIIGHFSGLDPLGQPLVELRGFNITPPRLTAKTTIDLQPGDAGREVVVMFINQDSTQPIITGLVRSPLYNIIEAGEQALTSLETHEPNFEENGASSLTKDQQLTVDGKKVLIEGSEEVVLKCGASSITLTKAGKVLIRGTYLLNRSSGVNRIMGGSVQVN